MQDSPDAFKVVVERNGKGSIFELNIDAHHRLVCDGERDERLVELLQESEAECLEANRRGGEYFSGRDLKPECARDRSVFQNDVTDKCNVI